MIESYWFSFEETGVLEVDMLLDAIAYAGKQQHSTEFWTDDDYGMSCVDRIQFQANKVAEYIGELKKNA